MKSAVNSQSEIVIERSRFADYVVLTKPELTLLSVATTLAGFYLASSGSLHFALLLHTLIGTALVGGGAGALNQYIEREYDGMMKRTENRPLPAGRLAPIEGLLFGGGISILGLLELTLYTNVLTGCLAAITIASYLFLYTPLKRISSLSTVVGGIPGALPPIMGWTAVKNDITVEAWILFAILFLWQMPHFFSLAWVYRKDYARAGFQMLTVLDVDGSVTSRQIVLYCLALVPVALLPSVVGLTGTTYLIGSGVLSIGFLAFGVSLFFTRTNSSARRMFFASLLYLPSLLVVMGLDKL
jgi:protoheme IX farnesyltransferase